MSLEGAELGYSLLQHVSPDDAGTAAAKTIPYATRLTPNSLYDAAAEHVIHDFHKSDPEMSQLKVMEKVTSLFLFLLSQHAIFPAHCGLKSMVNTDMYQTTRLMDEMQASCHNS